MSDEQQPETPQNTPQAPQWIAVPPAVPPTAQGPSGRRGLAIAAMAIGLMAILTAVVSAFYFSIFIVLGAVLGLVAVGLGIAALVKRQVPRPASVTGLVAGGLAVVVAVAIGGIALGSFTAAQIPSSGSGSSEAGEEAPDEGDGGDDWSPEEEQESLIEWPANMATGGFLFAAGDGGPEPERSAPLAAGTAPEPAAVDRGNGPADILLYVDYRCPHCVDFEAVNADALEDLVSSGAATLEIRPMSFVSPFSQHLSGAMSCVVDAQPESAWAAHLALLDRETQHIAGAAELIAVLDDATGGLGDAARSCIESERFLVFAQALSDWYVASPVPNAVDPALRVQGTPLAVVNGVPYTGPPSDQAAFAAFLAAQGL